MHGVCPRLDSKYLLCLHFDGKMMHEVCPRLNRIWAYYYTHRACLLSDRKSPSWPQYAVNFVLSTEKKHENSRLIQTKQVIVISHLSSNRLETILKREGCDATKFSPFLVFLIVPEQMLLLVSRGFLQNVEEFDNKEAWKGTFLKRNVELPQSKMDVRSVQHTLYRFAIVVNGLWCEICEQPRTLCVWLFFRTN